MLEELRKVEVLDDDFSDRYIIWEYKGYKVIESGCKDDEGFYKYYCEVRYNEDDIARFHSLQECCDYIDNISLNALKEIREDIELRIRATCDWVKGVGHLEPHFSIVEKSLRALQIIKEKIVDIPYLNKANDLDDYNTAHRINDELTQEEYDLLKEVLR